IVRSDSARNPESRWRIAKIETPPCADAQTQNETARQKVARKKHRDTQSKKRQDLQRRRRQRTRATKARLRRRPLRDRPQRRRALPLSPHRRLNPPFRKSRVRAQPTNALKW